MHAAEVVALGYDYPNPGRLDELSRAVATSSRGAVAGHMTEFVGAIGGLSLGEWEELHTRTLDLSPLFVPYVGHVRWGENYRRGEFMAELNGAMTVAGVDRAEELPDHIAPVLRYLARTDRPVPELLEILPDAVMAMKSTLQQAAPSNPYRHLLAATVAVVQEHNVVIMGGGR
jgi:nitrate reductase delta subunit